MRPIKPSELEGVERIPAAVLVAFNDLIKEKFDGHVAVVKQDEVVDRILAKLPNTKREEVYKKKWLDVEDLYRKEGWEVVYNKPSWGETYDAYFEFRAVRVTR